MPGARGAAIVARRPRAYFCKMQDDVTGDAWGPAAKTRAVDGAKLSPAAERALAEAAARRRERTKPDRPQELPARGGLDPTRYGDWEKNGIASDF